ncbi:hypothetical protein SBOR_8192 [Sclerotinia borealis F-4128]|uniref:Uncharacterized protein n=1 Tax=Sclerotinia borealis (strain F-4128) TaxID=1432307 RepID=W9C6S3_SCLBF|nr:hypothetical protein SBOR_8192 [Sclerotinia borealis F-4128]
MGQQSSRSTVEGEAGEMDFDRLVEVRPAIKLLHFERAAEMREKCNEWETGRAQEQNEELRNMGKVEKFWIEDGLRFG